MSTDMDSRSLREIVDPIAVVSNAVEAAQPTAVQLRSFRLPTQGEAIECDGQKYWIHEPIGKGSFGQVFACTDEWSSALVAKVLSPRDQTYEQVRSAWQAEIEKLMVMRHPNITFVHQAFEYRDTFYIIMERCFETLELVINLEDLAPDNWIPFVARDVLHALNFMHSMGYVHKDLHPGNVFVALTKDRMVPAREAVWSFKLGDLGISRLESEIRPLNTQLAKWMLPPEAIQPESFGVVGKGTDIYHTGLLLLALLLNKTPEFSQEDVVAGVPRQLAESHPSRFVPAIARALRRHVANRTATAMQFWREISAVA